MLGEVGDVRDGGQQPVGRPKEKWSDCVMEHMNLLGGRSMWHKIDRCAKLSSSVQPHPGWENVNVK